MSPTILIRTLVAALAISAALAFVASAHGAELVETASTQTLVFPGLVVQVTAPDGLEIVQTDEAPDWPDEWVCTNEPQDDPATIVEACGPRWMIEADYPGQPTWPSVL